MSAPATVRRRPPSRRTDPVTAYARDVVRGKVLAGWRVRRACERHLRDLDAGAARGLRFDAEMAERAISFFPRVLRLAEGEFAGKPFVLQPWQAFIIGSLFGWLRADGTRRFREAYVEAGKGSGKTPLVAGTGLYGLTADGEPGAEIYSAATKLEQAKILFGDAEKMVRASPALAARMTITANNIAYLAAGSFFRAISSEKRGLDGPRVHMGLIDEIHEHPDDVVVEKIKKGRKGRRQPLIFMITNSGYDRHTVCWHYHEYGEKVLTGIIENDEFFAYICGLDPCEACWNGGATQPKDGCQDCDDWRDESVWLKANPNLGVSLPWDYLRQEVLQAQELPHKRNITLRLNFCIWTEQASLWLPLDKWDAGAAEGIWDDAGAMYVERLQGRSCYGGLDLSSKIDLTAFVLRFAPDEEGKVDVLEWFWCPEETIAQRAQRDQAPYDQWVRDGWLYATPGPVVDYDAVRSFVEAVSAYYQVEEIGFDPWNATQIATQLIERGARMIEVRQGYYSLSEASKAWEALIVSGRERHRNHPVMRWMISNLSREEDPAGNIKPSKARSRDRIDGPVARIIAETRAMVATAAKPRGISVYIPGGGA